MCSPIEIANSMISSPSWGNIHGCLPGTAHMYTCLTNIYIKWKKTSNSQDNFVKEQGWRTHKEELINVQICYKATVIKMM